MKGSEISSHCIAVSSNQYQKDKYCDCTETIQSLLKKNNGVTSVQFVIVST